MRILCIFFSFWVPIIIGWKECSTGIREIKTHPSCVSSYLDIRENSFYLWVKNFFIVNFMVQRYYLCWYADSEGQSNEFWFDFFIAYTLSRDRQQANTMPVSWLTTRISVSHARSLTQVAVILQLARCPSAGILNVKWSKQPTLAL